MRSLEERAILRQAAAIKSAELKKRKREHRAKVEPVKRDRGRVRDNNHLKFIRRLPCIANWVLYGVTHYGCDAAHVRFADPARGKPLTGGMVKPDDKWALPLTRTEHILQHSVNERSYWQRLGVDPLDLCERLYAVSGDHEAAVAIITNLPRRSVERRETRG